MFKIKNRAKYIIEDPVLEKIGKKLEENIIKKLNTESLGLNSRTRWEIILDYTINNLSSISNSVIAYNCNDSKYIIEMNFASNTDNYNKAQKIFAKYAKDEDKTKRFGVAWNSFVALDLFEDLIFDKDKIIRTAATTNLVLKKQSQQIYLGSLYDWKISKVFKESIIENKHLEQRLRREDEKTAKKKGIIIKILKLEFPFKK